jgi:hypothetical protein
MKYSCVFWVTGNFIFTPQLTNLDTFHETCMSYRVFACSNLGSAFDYNHKYHLTQCYLNTYQYLLLLNSRTVGIVKPKKALFEEQMSPYSFDVTTTSFSKGIIKCIFLQFHCGRCSFPITRDKGLYEEFVLTLQCYIVPWGESTVLHRNNPTVRGCTPVRCYIETTQPLGAVLLYGVT